MIIDNKDTDLQVTYCFRNSLLSWLNTWFLGRSQVLHPWSC